MDVVNSNAKQQVTQSQQSVAEAKPTPKQEVKIQLEKVINQEKAQEPQPKEVDVKSLIDSMNKALDPFNTSIQFGFDNSNDVFFVSVIDTYTNDTIRRFPVEQAESFIAQMHEIVGIIFDEKG